MFSEFSKSLQGARHCIHTVGEVTSWGGEGSIAESLTNDYTGFYSDVAYIGHSLNDVELQTKKTKAIITKWNNAPLKSSVVELCYELLKAFGFNDEEHYDLNVAVFVAAALADVPNGLAYHNNLHFKKVVFHVARMIAAHNYIFENGLGSFDKSQIAQLLIAACIHDLGHDGTGNIVDRKYVMAATELKSFGYAETYLTESGLEQDVIDRIKIMLICTDASPFGDPVSPSRQLRRVYAYHFGDEEAVGDLELCDELSILKERERLAVMCMVLHEADLLNSAGVDYELTLEESIAVSCEMKTDATPESTLLFFEKTCMNDLFTDCGRYLGQKNFDSIRVQVIDDYNKGNKAYS